MPGHVHAFLLQGFLEHRQERQRQHLNALLQQFDRFARAGLTPNTAVFNFPVVHSARLFGKTLSDIFRMGHHVAQGVQESGLRGGVRAIALLINFGLIMASARTGQGRY